MDYTWLAQVKADAKISETTDDALLATKISQASREIDRLVAGQEDAADYFALGTVTDEILNSYRNPIVSQSGILEFYPHKAIIKSLTALSVRATPLEAWQPVNTQYCDIVRGRSVRVYGGNYDPDAIQVKISYSGGLGTITSTTAGTPSVTTVTNTLPMDLVELATLLTIRLYREAMGGMSDAIGIAELGTILYSKALPVRAELFITAFTRTFPW
jgi:hypothetical protein